MLVVANEEDALAQLRAGHLCCTRCGGPLAPWGYARPRKLRGVAGAAVELKPRQPRWGSLVARTTRCGNSGCACHTDPDKRHGPYPSWTRRVAGKTVTRTLSVEQAERYKPFFQNSRRLKGLVEDLEALSVRVVSEAEGWANPLEG